MRVYGRSYKRPRSYHASGDKDHISAFEGSHDGILGFFCSPLSNIRVSTSAESARQFLTDLNASILGERRAFERLRAKEGDGSE